jgi:apolipoprotein N-acyltransferase
MHFFVAEHSMIRTDGCLALLAALAGVLTSLPWLDERLWWAAWVGMTLWIAISSGQPAYVAFRLWLLGGVALLALGFHWMPGVAAGHLEVSLAAATIVTLLAVTWDAFRFGVFGYLVASIAPRGAWATLAWPTVWVALEWVWPHLFPWRIGQSQLGWLGFCQVAEVTGVFGVSFLFMWGAAVAAEWAKAFAASRQMGSAESTPSRVAAVICALALGANVAWGMWRMRGVEADAAERPKMRLALVQPGVRDEQMLQVLQTLSMKIRAGVDLVVWGESAVGAYSVDLKDFGSAGGSPADSRQDVPDPPPCPGLGCPLLCGGTSFEPGARKTGPYWNTAFLIAADDTIESRYHKRVLMPWGEYAVGQQWVPGLRDLLADTEALVAGTSAAPLRFADQARLGILICYEDVVPSATRQTVLEGANILLNLNNLSIFGRTTALMEHQHLARFRAIENRRWLVRCGTTGSTAVIAASGRVEQQAPRNVPATLVASVPLIEPMSIYTRYGDFVAWLCAAASIGLVLWRSAIQFGGGRER